MANHKSALKRIRSNEKRRVLNRYQHKTTRNAIKALRMATDKSDADKKLSTLPYYPYMKIQIIALR